MRTRPGKGDAKEWEKAPGRLPEARHIMAVVGVVSQTGLLHVHSPYTYTHTHKHTHTQRERNTDTNKDREKHTQKERGGRERDKTHTLQIFVPGVISHQPVLTKPHTHSGRYTGHGPSGLSQQPGYQLLPTPVPHSQQTSKSLKEYFSFLCCKVQTLSHVAPS